jgi:hypothetical protein
LDALRLAFGLREVGRPGCVAQTLCFVAGGEVEQGVQRAGVAVHAGVRVADTRRSVPAW